MFIRLEGHLASSKHFHRHNSANLSFNRLNHRARRSESILSEIVLLPTVMSSNLDLDLGIHILSSRREKIPLGVCKIRVYDPSLCVGATIALQILQYVACDI